MVTFLSGCDSLRGDIPRPVRIISAGTRFVEAAHTCLYRDPKIEVRVTFIGAAILVPARAHS